MRHGLKKRIGILLCMSLVFSTVVWPEDVGVGNSVGILAAAEETQDTDTAEYTDATTGYTYTLYEGEDGNTGTVQKAEITGYTGTDWNLVIPSTVTYEGTEVPVGSIGASAFEQNANVTGVTFLEGAEVTIGERAFYQCENLMSVSLSSTLTWENRSGSMEAYAAYDSAEIFGKCTSLKNLKLADGLTILPSYSFEGCVSLESVRIPSHLEWFGRSVFADCTSLKQVEIPEGVQEIGYEAFVNCLSLTEVVIPSTIEAWRTLSNYGKTNNITYHECYAFSGCTSLEKVTFTDGLKTLKYGVLFKGCTSLKSITVPSSVEEIDYAFYDCSSLEEITLQEGSLKVIGPYAFYKCNSLEKIYIPSTVAEVGEDAFCNCSSLKTLTFPSNCTSFTGNANSTSGCTGLDSIYLLCEDLGECTPQGLAFGLSSEGMLYCQAESSTYEKIYTIFERENRLSQLSVLSTDMLGVTVEGYRGVYDGDSHPLVTLTGVEEADEVSYGMLEEDGTEGESLTEVPERTEPGNYSIRVTVLRDGIKYPTTVQAEIQKKTAVITLSDMTVYQEDSWEIVPETYDGPEDIIYTYYRDETLKKKCSSKPTLAGVYYVKATVEESQYYTAGESNVAKVEVLEGSAPVTSPSTEPGTDPSTNPSTEPGTGLSTNPNVSQGTVPSAGPTKSPNSGSNALKKGSTFTKGQLKYKVTNATDGKLAAAVQAPKSRKVKSLTVPASVKINGNTYKVTSVAVNAFKNCKKLTKVTVGKNVTAIGKNAFSNAKALKKITVKSANLKSVGKNALKGIHKKAIVKVPKAKLKKYRKLFKGKGQKKTVKIR